VFRTQQLMGCSLVGHQSPPSLLPSPLLFLLPSCHSCRPPFFVASCRTSGLPPALTHFAPTVLPSRPHLPALSPSCFPALLLSHPPAFPPSCPPALLLSRPPAPPMRSLLPCCPPACAASVLWPSHPARSLTPSRSRVFEVPLKNRS
jgi:hypothetical protein